LALTEKAAIEASGQKAVPVLVDGAKWVADSWAIAEYLDETYPQAPTLFGGPAGKALTGFHARFADTVLVMGLLRFILVDIYEHLHEKDRDYFRKTREERLGTSFESFIADRDARLPGFRDSLNPLRLVLKAQPFFGGEAPLYADYAVFGCFMWARAISPYALLAQDDPIAAWRERMLDLFGGLARKAPGYDS
jgi:glutathione S-transferase